MDDLDQRLNAVLSALRTIRVRRLDQEIEYLHPLVAGALDSAGIRYQHEVKLGPRKRVDFLVTDIIIEIKKRKPVRANLFAQLEKYASCDIVRAIVLILERSVPVPEHIHGKPVRMISLNTLWGLSV